MSEAKSLVKQIAIIRRRNGLTRKEFFDYHFCVHGALADKPENNDGKPHKYIQTHFFNSAYGGRVGSIAGTSNHSWVGRDDMTELYFRDWMHLRACFGTSYVRDIVGPDGVNFNDLETAIPLMAHEKSIKLNTDLSSSYDVKEGYRTVAMLFPALKVQKPEPELELLLTPALVRALEVHASEEVGGLLANIGIPASQFDVREYFGGKDMPEHPVSYKIYLRDYNSVKAVRKAQKSFQESLGDQLDADHTFVTFGKEGLIIDVENGLGFDPARQPHLSDLGP